MQVLIMDEADQLLDMGYVNSWIGVISVLLLPCSITTGVIDSSSLLSPCSIIISLHITIILIITHFSISVHLQFYIVIRFERDVEAIIQALPPKADRQTLLFSATVPGSVEKIAKKALRPGYEYVNM